MNNYLKISSITIASLLALSACCSPDHSTNIPIAEVPAKLITVIQNSLPGIALTKAEKQIKNDTVIYELEGRLINGKEYEIKLKEDGTIIEIDLED